LLQSEQESNPYLQQAILHFDKIPFTPVHITPHIQSLQVSDVQDYVRLKIRNGILKIRLLSVCEEEITVEMIFPFHSILFQIRWGCIRIRGFECLPVTAPSRLKLNKSYRGVSGKKTNQG